jgi:hypothetical protein
MTIPSQASEEEGVETRRAAPHVGEGIVQTTKHFGGSESYSGT